MDPATEVGPVVAERQRTRIEGYLDSGREEGATVALGGGRPSGRDFAKGWYVEPTVFSDVDNKMKIAQEEIFGPVLVVIPYDGDEQRGRDRQRLELRPVRLGVDGRQRPRPGRGPPGAHRDLHAQRARADRLLDARSAATRSRASAASSGPRASRASWRRSRSPAGGVHAGSLKGPAAARAGRAPATRVGRLRSGGAGR